MRSSSEGKTGTVARTAEQINNAGKEQATSKRARLTSLQLPSTLRRETLGNPCKSLFQVAFSPICDSRIQTSPSDNTHHMQPYAS